MSDRSEETNEASTRIFHEATEEAQLRRLKQRRYIRVTVTEDVAKKRFKAPADISEKASLVDESYNDEVEVAERRLIASETAVKEAKEVVELFQQFTDGKIPASGEFLIIPSPPKGG